MLGLQVLVWVVAHGISDTNLDGYADMLENFAWGQTVEWGSAKHPPLFAWITGAWFAVFPNLDAAYHLLSYANAALGLLGVYRMAQALGRCGLVTQCAGNGTSGLDWVCGFGGAECTGHAGQVLQRCVFAGCVFDRTHHKRRSSVVYNVQAMVRLGHVCVVFVAPPSVAEHP